MIVAIRTDSPITELYLLDGAGRVLEQDTWESGNRLSNELLKHLERLLRSRKRDLSDISGLVVYKGPGSFTGLRIGITVANTIAYGNSAPVVGTTGQNWLRDGFELLSQQKPGTQVFPEYGGEPNITKPRK